MNTFYGDPAKQQRATTKLHAMKQGNNEAFFYFLPRFETTLADAGGMTWADASKMAILTAATNGSMKQYLIGREPCTTYCELKERLLTIGSQMTALHAAQRRTDRAPTNSPGVFWSSSSVGNGTSHGVQGPDAMDWEPTGPARIATARRSPNNNCGCPNGQRHTCGRKRATWVSKETLDYRRRHNLCIRCGNPGHIQSGCKRLPALPPNNNNVQVNQNQPYDRVKAQTDNDDEDEFELTGEESGN